MKPAVRRRAHHPNGPGNGTPRKRRSTKGRENDFHEAVPGIYRQGERLFTKNLTPGKRFFDEELVERDGIEYREFDPRRSKLGAAVMKGLRRSGFTTGSIVLYLGASHGYTPSFVADIVGKEGFVLCLDFSPRVVRDLVFLCEERENMAPLLADAKEPETYAAKVRALPPIDVLYQDIAQRDQVDIFLNNCNLFLKSGGHGLLAVKARSIDVTRRPGELFKEIRKRFEEEASYSLTDYRELQPFEKDHALFVVKKR